MIDIFDDDQEKWLIMIDIFDNDQENWNKELMNHDNIGHFHFYRDTVGQSWMSLKYDFLSHSKTLK